MLSLATVAWAKDEEPVTPDEFEQIVAGKVLEYRVAGSTRLVGYEAYMPERKVIFRYGDGSCTRGEWYSKRGDICFVYEGDPKPNCIRYVLRGRTLAAHDPRQDGTTDHFDIKVLKTKRLECSGA